MKRKLLIASMLALVLASLALLAGALTRSGGAQVAYPVPHPTVSDYEQVSKSETPPTQAQCASAGRRCFAPQAIRVSYNLLPLYTGGKDGTGRTIAIVDSYGSDTMAHDLHVFNRQFGLAPMCGEEGVTCTRGMPTFSELTLQGSRASAARRCAPIRTHD